MKEWQNVIDNFDKIKSAAATVPSLEKTALSVDSLEKIDKLAIGDPKLRDALSCFSLRLTNNDSNRFITKSEIQAAIDANDVDKAKLQIVLDNFSDAQKLLSASRDGLTAESLYKIKYGSNPGLDYVASNNISLDRDRNHIISKEEIGAEIEKLERAHTAKLAEYAEFAKNARQTIKDMELVAKNLDLIRRAINDPNIGISKKDFPPVPLADYEKALADLVKAPRNGRHFRFTDYEREKIHTILYEGCRDNGLDHNQTRATELEDRLNQLAAGAPYSFRVRAERSEGAHGGLTARRLTLDLIDTNAENQLMRTQ